jgi:diguanylate cyclase
MTEDLNKQIESWKQKYSSLHTEFDSQEKYAALLERTLGRLALAAQGLDENLDKYLTRLRSVLRAQSTDRREIESVLNRIEQAIGQMEEHQQAQTADNVNDILIELIESLSLSGSDKKKAKKLVKRIQSDEDDTLEKVSSVSSFIDEVLSESLAKSQSKTSSGFFSLFSKSSPVDALNDDIAVNTATQQADSDPEQTQTEDVLIKMLEHLSLPDKQCRQMLKLRQRIEDGITADQMSEVIEEFASIVSSLSMKLLADKREYEDYLKKVSGQLSTLDEYLLQSSQADTEAFENKSRLSQQFENEVSGLQTRVSRSNNLDQLKSMVSERLTILNQHIAQSQLTDRQSYEASQAKIQTLNQRIQEMEAESQTLQQDLAKQREIALRDALTGLWNRQALNEELDKEYTRWQRYKHPFTIIIWDIDFFKKINDTHGHKAGDGVLKVFAEKFLAKARKTDFTARFGGEEFVSILPETDLNQGLILANQIREKVSQTQFNYQGKVVPITASAGVATATEGCTVDSLMEAADKKLYQAKAEGRNCCRG